MFDLGFWEVLFICLIGLLVLGPERMARTARTLGLWLGRARASFMATRREIEQELHLEEIRRTGESLRQDVEQTGRDLKGQARELEREARASSGQGEAQSTEPGGEATEQGGEGREAGEERKQ